MKPKHVLVLPDQLTDQVGPLSLGEPGFTSVWAKRDMKVRSQILERADDVLGRLSQGML